MGRVILEIGGPNLRPEMAHAGSLLLEPSPLTSALNELKLKASLPS